jgi:hypothetical protein
MKHLQVIILLIIPVIRVWGLRLQFFTHKLGVVMKTPRTTTVTRGSSSNLELSRGRHKTPRRLKAAFSVRKSKKRRIMLWASLSFACLVICLHFQNSHSFLGNFGNAHNVLGADLDSNIDLKTGFVSGEASRTNIYGEVSTVKYHIKPNEHKLKLLLDEATACFDIQCRGSQVFMRSKFSLHDVPGCVNFGVSSFTSSSRTTGRLLRFDLQHRPSLNDLRKGDFVHSDLVCTPPGQQMTAGARLIVSIDRLSDTDKASKNTIFFINTREAHLTDAVSQGSFEFRTENILTVNELPRNPIFQTRWELAGGSRSISLLNLVRVCVAKIF